MPYAKLFRSRWAAMIWAAGILWTAVDVAGFSSPDAPATNNGTAAPDRDATGIAVANSDLAILAGVMNGN
ncbi:hypothetical protein ASG11_17520 [Sphingomonas sp. Leaf357]|uniref:hypothetical protein n=1 Tax=Sphingomonas sp. Leaf357 TaxID=1736350 RepID=UPI0006F39C9A|nr:hypothetical protein [Sphingomonas sp. Leaf357]KQS01462.1 hypothetical protein ASG11_17520 [Sphingomonas sp. Leaf357]